MSAVAQSPTEATEGLWRAHARDLVRFATLLTGPADAHDVVVEAFVRSAATIAGLEHRAARRYLTRAVVNQANNLHRARRRRWQRDLAAIRPDSTLDHHPDLDVLRAVSTLSLAQRSVIYFVYWEDLTERETAETLGVAPGTVRRHLVRARLQLRKALR